MSIDRDLIRWGLLIGATPIWLPFLRALWRDFNHALREEGGLFGRVPTARELETIRREHGKVPESLISEPWIAAGDRRTPRLRTPTARPGQAKPGGQAGMRGTDKPRGFR